MCHIKNAPVREKERGGLGRRGGVGGEELIYSSCLLFKTSLSLSLSLSSLSLSLFSLSLSLSLSLAGG